MGEAYTSTSFAAALAIAAVSVTSAVAIEASKTARRFIAAFSVGECTVFQLCQGERDGGALINTRL